ncbi:hypothetical protein KHA80_17535 [Anaerobacillus sp. HL2]|nr:hypothetical protein KHA80_17535 [Anaerobacillus sp. HL2]
MSLIKKFSRHLVDGTINDYITKPYSIDEIKHRIIKGIIEFGKKTDSDTIRECLYQREVMLQTIAVICSMSLPC